MFVRYTPSEAWDSTQRYGTSACDSAAHDSLFTSKLLVTPRVVPKPELEVKIQKKKKLPVAGRGGL